MMTINSCVSLKQMLEANKNLG